MSYAYDTLFKMPKCKSVLFKMFACKFFSFFFGGGQRAKKNICVRIVPSFYFHLLLYVLFFRNVYLYRFSNQPFCLFLFSGSELENIACRGNCISCLHRSQQVRVINSAKIAPNTLDWTGYPATGPFGCHGSLIIWLNDSLC